MSDHKVSTFKTVNYGTIEVDYSKREVYFKESDLLAPLKADNNFIHPFHCREFCVIGDKLNIVEYHDVCLLEDL